jgi:hypothetical protein
MHNRSRVHSIRGKTGANRAIQYNGDENASSEKYLLKFSKNISSTNDTRNSLYYLDINECDMQNECNETAMCINTAGSYDCQCMNGTSGDGYSVGCEGIRVR